MTHYQNFLGIILYLLNIYHYVLFLASLHTILSIYLYISFVYIDKKLFQKLILLILVPNIFANSLIIILLEKFDDYYELYKL
jgi:hypothetical protein